MSPSMIAARELDLLVLKGSQVPQIMFVWKFQKDTLAIAS